MLARENMAETVKILHTVVYNPTYMMILKTFYIFNEIKF